MSLKDRVVVSGTRITLVTFQGPPRVGLVLSPEECVELVEALIPAVAEAEENRKKGLASASNSPFCGAKNKENV
jgi:hypothetical protein